MSLQNSLTLPGDAAEYAVRQDYSKYGPEEQRTWSYLFSRRMDQLRDHACREYLEGMDLLGMTSEKIPVIESLNPVLQKRSDWTLLPVSGFLPGRTFFDLLAARLFPTTTYIRKADSLDYTPEPDIFHDIFGHVPMHTNRVFADYLQSFAELARHVDSDAEQERLGRLFWFTVEFGLIRQDGAIRLYGSGVISSVKESSNIVEGRQKIRDFELHEVLNTVVKVDEPQPVLFAIDSFDQMYEAMRQARELFHVSI